MIKTFFIKKYLNLILFFSLFLVLGTITSIFSQEQQVKEFQTTNKSLQPTNDFESFIKDFVTHVDTRLVTYKNGSLYFYADASTKKDSIAVALMTSILLGAGAASMQFVGKKYIPENFDNREPIPCLTFSIIYGTIATFFTLSVLLNLLRKFQRLPILTITPKEISAIGQSSIKWSELNDIQIHTVTVKDQRGSTIELVKSLIFIAKNPRTENVFTLVVSDTIKTDSKSSIKTGFLPITIEKLKEIATRYKNNFVKNVQTN